jgi:hypothetical protein
MKTWKTFAIIAIFGIALVFNACNNETTSSDPVCKCPNGTLHLVGEICCDGKDCECETGVIGVRSDVPGKASNGIAITNRFGIDLVEFDDMVEKVNTALNHWVFETTNRQTFIKNSIKEIRILPSDDYDDIDSNPYPDCYFPNGVFLVRNTGSALWISGFIMDWVDVNAKKVVDAAGKLVGTCINGYGEVIKSGNYSFNINMTTGELFNSNAWATEVNGGGTLFGPSYYTTQYPNCVVKVGNNYYIAKDRDAEGYPTTLKSVLWQSFYTSQNGVDYIWVNYSPTTTNNLVELEKIADATNSSYFIGFTPTLPLDYEF